MSPAVKRNSDNNDDILPITMTLKREVLNSNRDDFTDLGVCQKQIIDVLCNECFDVQPQARYQRDSFHCLAERIELYRQEQESRDTIYLLQ